MSGFEPELPRTSRWAAVRPLHAHVDTRLVAASNPSRPILCFLNAVFVAEHAPKAFVFAVRVHGVAPNVAGQVLVIDLDFAPKHLLRLLQGSPCHLAVLLEDILPGHVDEPYLSPVPPGTVTGPEGIRGTAHGKPAVVHEEQGQNDGHLLLLADSRFHFVPPRIVL